MAAVIGSLRAELSATVAQFQEDMGRAADTVKKTAAEFTRAGNDFRKVGTQMQSIGSALTKSITVPLAGVGIAVAKVGIDFETAFAGVRKTVAGAVDDLGQLTPVGEKLQQGFRDLAKEIPVSVNELARLGETAGALGIPTEAVLEFAKVMAQLGVTTNLTSDQAADSIAKIQNIFGAAGKDTDRLAATLVALGNAGASTESEILEMGKRIAGAGHTIGLTEGQVLAFGSALSSVGIEAEAGGSAISRVFVDLAQAVNHGGSELTKFAKVAGQSSADFAQAFKTDAAGATTSFIEGLGKIQKSGGDVFGTLESLGITEVRMRDALLRAAGAGDLLRDSLTLQASAWQANSALTKEAEQRFQTTESQLTLLWNRIKDVGITLFNALKPAIEAAIAGLNKMLPYVEMLAQAFSALPGGVQLAIIGVAAFAAALGPIIFISGQLVSSLGALTLAFGKGGVGTRALVGGLGLAEKALGSLTGALDVGRVTAWAGSLQASGGIVGRFGGVIGSVIATGLGPLAGVLSTVGTAIVGLFNPVTLAIGAFVALGVGVAALTGHWDDVQAGITAVIQVVKDVASGLWYLAKTVIATLVDGLIGLAKWLGSGLVAGFQALLSVAKAIITPFVDFGIAINDAINNLGPLGTALKVVGVALVALVNPVAGVVAGVALMVGHWDELTAVMGTVVQAVKDLGTVFVFFAEGAIASLVDGFSELVTWIGSGLVGGFRGLVSVVQAVVQPCAELASLIAGPVIEAFKSLGGLLSGVGGWFSGLIGWIGKAAVATKDLAVSGVQSLHAYAQAVRDMAKDVEAGFQQANKGLADYRKTITDRDIPTAAQDIGSAMALLKTQLSGIGSAGVNGFAGLTDALKAARAELAKLTPKEVTALSEAIKSGAFTMKELERETGLSETALKLFEDRVRDNAKEMKASQSIFDDYKKKVSELTVGLTEALKFGVPTEFIKRQFGSVISDVVDQASILGKTLPKIISDAFLKITIKDATDQLQKEFAKFGDEMNKQVKADMDRRNAIVVKALGVQIDAEQSAADSIVQFSINGLQNRIKNIEAINGKTKESIALRLQLYAEEYQYQIAQIAKEAQAKKDSLDQTVGDYEAAFDAIDAATALKMGLASQTYRQKITEMDTATHSLRSTLDTLGDAFSKLSQVAGGSFGGVVQEIGTIISAMSLAAKSVDEFKQATTVAGKAAALAGGVAAVAQATSSKNKTSAVIGGALAGAQVGSIVPGVGTAIGAGAGALVGYLRAIHKGPAEKAAIDVGRDFGVSISEGLAKELGEQGKQIGRQAANVFNLDKIIAEGGGLNTENIGKYTAKLRDTFVLVKQGALTAADGAVVLDKNFGNFANQFLKNGPLISKELVEIVKLTDEMGIKSQAVADFIASQVTSTIVPGLEAFANASKGAVDALAENQKKLADLQSQLGSASGADQERLRKEIADVTAEIAKQQGVIQATTVTSENAANALSAAVAVAFTEMQKAGIPILEIADKLAPVVDGLAKQFESAGFTGGAAFEKIRNLVTLAADEIAGPAIQAATGLGQALSGLSNIGQLNQETFTGLTEQIAATFNSLISQGNDGNTVLALLQQPLQAVWQLATEFGYAIDDGTRALLEQAQAAGVVGEKQKPLQEQMLDATNKIATAVTALAKVFGADLPAAAQTGAKGVEDAFAKVHPKIDVDIRYNDPGFTPEVDGAATGGMVTPRGIQHFAVGGLVQKLKGFQGFQSRGTDTVPAMLTPGELVLNKAQQQAVSSAMNGPLSVLQHQEGRADGHLADLQSANPQKSGDTITVHLTIPITTMDSASMRDAVVKPGGIADLVIDSVSQGKRGRDERLRRGLALQ